ncbi:hypothetical protein Q3G72_016638 [Acer saccharum]|nr:hypothetical protein Q3G72_016638 [Acer saccharum]
MRPMQAEIQARDKALEIMKKKKEIDHLAELARSKQEKEEMPNLSQASSSAKVKEPNPSKAKKRKAKRRNKNPPPPPPPPTKNHQQGILPNPITMCHHCRKIGHIRPLSQECERHGTCGNFGKREKYRHVRKAWVEKPKNRKSPPRIKKIWGAVFAPIDVTPTSPKESP